MKREEDELNCRNTEMMVKIERKEEQGTFSSKFYWLSKISDNTFDLTSTFKTHCSSSIIIIK